MCEVDWCKSALVLRIEIGGFVCQCGGRGGVGGRCVGVGVSEIWREDFCQSGYS